MTQKPTGVFVLLPLSDEQIVSIAGWIPGSREELRNEVLPSIFSIIGTPVQESGLTCIGNIVWFENDREPVLGSYVPAVFKQGSGVPVASLHEAQAQIAARDAEIVRLRKGLALIAESANIDNCLDPARNKRVAVHFLKGGAA